MNVRRLRELHGLSLSQLSERSGIAKATLFKVERERTNATLDTIESHSQVFNANFVETSASHGIGSREHVLVRAGIIRIGPVGEEMLIKPGDYATYPADTTHHWEAVGIDASVWIVHTFPKPSMLM